MSDRSEANGDSHITIPEEALERVARKIAMLCEDGTENWQDYLFDASDLCLAMLRAWPGVTERFFPNDPTRPPGIFLPLPKEGEQ